MKTKTKKIVKIKENIGIEELLSKYPYLGDILTYEYGLHCVNCIISGFDTLKEGALIHGITGKYFKEMLKHLESLVNANSKVVKK